MAYAREIFQKIKEKIHFQKAKKEADSYYTILGNTLVRISNHCTWMKVWDDMLNKNPKWKGKPIVSIVFEDNGNTFCEDCLFSLGYRKRPIKVQEYVYESAHLEKLDISLIIQSIIAISKSNNYIDQTKKCESHKRISICPDFNNIEIGMDGMPRMGGICGADYIPESKNNNHKKSITMNNKKKKIRLTESQLHNLIKRSVKNVLLESSDSVSPQPYDGDSSYFPSEEELKRSDEFHKRTHPWRYMTEFKLNKLIELGYFSRDKFESGEWSITNFLSDLDKLVN